MRPDVLRDLRNKGLLTESQYTNIESIVSKKIFSVFYELRIILYVGVMLFVAGTGILVYKNIGELGHVLSILALSLITVLCFGYAFQKVEKYTHEKLKPPTAYFDYVVILGCLLLISVLGYLQFQFGILNENLAVSTLITAAIFFYTAYRFDHLGVLSMAITALASFWSLSVSPQKWYSSNFFSTAHLYITAIIFSLVMAGIVMALDRKKIKVHFTFTYLNFCFLIFFVGVLTGMFEGSVGLFLLLLYGGCALAILAAWRMKAFLFLLYAFVSGYIGTTYFLVESVSWRLEFWYFYFFASCGGFIYFIINYKNYFRRQS